LERVSPFPIVQHAIGTKEKTALLARVRAARGVGIVFKLLDSPYRPEQHLFGVKFNDHSTAQIAIEKCSLGSQRGGKPLSRFVKVVPNKPMPLCDVRASSL
jgi:hypothetical protein